jgi:uncharacterized protein
MGKIIKDLKVPLGEDLAEKLALLEPNLESFRILKKSIDARGNKSPEWIYSLETFAKNEEIPENKIVVEKTAAGSTLRPLIIGAGPAGLFAALRLIERGFKPILFERGSPAEKRIAAINKYWRYGQLDLDDNVCFGEGGAGLYSDGKLITRIKSPFIPYVMDRLVQFGAPEEIKYLANPHVGSDKIRRVIPKIRQYLLQEGCDIHFNAKVKTLIFEGDKVSGLVTESGQRFDSQAVILATGHSANDMFEHLHENGVRMEGKSFALGLRVEHSQDFINEAQYGDYKDHPELGAANYRLTHHDYKNEIGVYSFCMCPGGYILSSGTEPDGVVSNGMSNYNRNSPRANAAIVVSIDHEKMFGSDIFGGMKFRREIENRAFLSVQEKGGTKQLPVQDVLSFMTATDATNTSTSSPSGVVPTRMDQLLPASLYLRLVEAFEDFDRKMKGFISPKAQLHGMETRTSCPIRIPRDPETLQSKSHRGLYPSGEGAGYAGGITSAACDGVRIADAICEQFK